MQVQMKPTRNCPSAVQVCADSRDFEAGHGNAFSGKRRKVGKLRLKENCKGPAPGWGWPSLGGLPTPAPLQEPEG